MISQDRLDQIMAVVQRAGLSQEIVQALREAFTDLHLTYCSDDDIMGATPVRSAANCHLYLVDGRGHCLSLTTDLEVATGVVLAEIDPSA
ncbi:hypothetical protein CKO25_00475 [Thiocapsa imhoffii]|uniref:DUF6129 domain-containing protein n=1 Tax=Thiocapsa imhoffii TaxID=382777 RepID=A0A9X0WEH7_9GAMM|nr:DUF6129 family protein [Thiocapsa imhoffii]MBK1643152.1 hypothetical protein [Thiocapsa imhoffii]